MANVAIFVSAVITFFIPFLIVFAVLYSAGLKKKKGSTQGKLSFELPKLDLGGQHSRRGRITENACKFRARELKSTQTTNN